MLPQFILSLDDCPDIGMGVLGSFLHSFWVAEQPHLLGNRAAALWPRQARMLLVSSVHAGMATQQERMLESSPTKECRIVLKQAGPHAAQVEIVQFC